MIDLRNLRRCAGLSQAALAARCAARAGRSEAYWCAVVNRWENGAREPNDAQRAAVLAALGVGDAAREYLAPHVAALVALGGRDGAVVALRLLADTLEAGR